MQLIVCSTTSPTRGHQLRGTRPPLVLLDCELCCSRASLADTQLHNSCVRHYLCCCPGITLFLPSSSPCVPLPLTCHWVRPRACWQCTGSWALPPPVPACLISPAPTAAAPAHSSPHCRAFIHVHTGREAKYKQGAQDAHTPSHQLLDEQGSATPAARALSMLPDATAAGLVVPVVELFCHTDPLQGKAPALQLL